MRNASRRLGFLLSSLVGMGPAAFAWASTDAIPPATSRIMIRGAGNTISVERSDAGSRRLLSRGGARAAVLERAVEMKAGGAADTALVAYLEAHAAGIPGLVDFGTVARLRDAGAGKTVFAYLTTVSAVEIGPTGAAGGSREEPAEGAPPEAAMSNELPASLAYGGFVVGGGRGARMMRLRGLRRGGFLLPPGTSGARRVPAPMMAPPPRFGRR